MKTRGQGPATPPANIVAAAHSPTKKTPGGKPAKTPAPLRRLLSTRSAEALEAGTLDVDGDGGDDDGVRPVDDDAPTLGTTTTTMTTMRMRRRSRAGPTTSPTPGVVVGG